MNINFIKAWLIYAVLFSDFYNKYETKYAKYLKRFVKYAKEDLC